MYRIFIVEDDEVIARVLGEHLRQWGYTTQCVQDFEHVLAEVDAFAPQLILLDISLPFFNGFHWCAELRRRSCVPIIFLSSASDQMNAVMAMQLGGDDFIAKPFDLTVLTAKIQALLQGDVKIPLSRNEYRILRLLLEQHGHIVSRDAIMTALWESDSFVDENTLSVNVNRLRRKLESAGVRDLIQTRKGVGYLVE